MKLKREYKVGTPIRFKWYYNGDQFTNPNPSYVIKDGCVDSNTCLDDVIIYNQEEDMYYCVLLSDVI